MFPLWCCLIKFGISSHDLQSLIIWLELISRHFTCLTHLPPYVLILIMFVGYWLLNKASTVCFHDFLSFFPNGTSFFWKNRPPSALTVGGGSIRCSSTWKTTHRRPRISAERGRSGGAVERLGSGEEPGNHQYIYIYIYITANLSHMICLILFIFKYIYIYICILIYVYIG